jgi:hypothetical protein
VDVQIGWIKQIHAYFCEGNSREELPMTSEKCYEVDTLRIDWMDAVWGFKYNDRLIMWSDYNVSCQDTLGYVTAGNSRLARGHQNSIGTHHSHLQSRID